jgi:hypothetical protein
MSNNHVFDSGPEQRFGTWGCTTVVIAWFERDVSSGAIGGPSFGFSIVYCHLFCMKSAQVIVPSFSNDFSFLDKDTTDQRIGRYTPSATFSNIECVLHECLIFFGPHGWSSSPPKGIELKSLFVHPWIH